MRKTVIKLVVFIAAALLMTMPVAATEVETGGDVSINILYSSDLSPEKGDGFMLTLVKNGGDSETLDIDAYEYADHAYSTTMEPGTYVISDVNYTGDNERIIEEGYVCNLIFTVREGRYAEINIAVGEDTCNSIVDLYGNVVAKVNGESVGDWYAVKSTGNPEEDTIHGNGLKEQISAENDWKPEETDIPADSTPDTDIDDSQEKPEPIYYEDTESEKTGNPAFLAIPILLLAAIAGIVIFVLHRKGKI